MSEEQFIPLNVMARRLGVPTAGRIPHLRANRRFLFHADTVESALLARTKGEAGESGVDRAIAAVEEAKRARKELAKAASESEARRE